MKKNIITALFLLIAFFFACTSKEDETKKNGNSLTTNEKTGDTYSLNMPLTELALYDEGLPITDEEIDEYAPFNTKEFKEYYSEEYKNKTQPPPFDFNMDLSNKTFKELRLLRAEIFARHGYLFMDYVLRAHFVKTKWYQPVFWYNDFKIRLNDEEKKFVDKVLKRELELYKERYIMVDGLKKANIDHVVNWVQFENISPTTKEHLIRDGFVIHKAEHEQLFHLYDDNHYNYIPNFITTDLILQVIHMHISKEMQAIEQEKMISLLTELFTDQIALHKQTAKSSTSELAKKAAMWNATYYTIALSLISGKEMEIQNEYTALYKTEMERIQKGEGRKSIFTGDSLLDYSQFQPRGNYTRNDSLKNYFRCVKWLNSAPMFLDEDEGVARAVLMAKNIMKSKNSSKNYTAFSDIISFLAGDDNNLSLFHLHKIMENYKEDDADQLLSAGNLSSIRDELYAADPKKMHRKGVNAVTNAFLERKKMLFTAGKYTFDGEILQRLIHIADPQPKRAFPKGLDVFAAMGNKTAEDILLNTYKENQKWVAYTDTLNFFKKKIQHI